MLSLQMNAVGIQRQQLSGKGALREVQRDHANAGSWGECWAELRGELRAQTAWCLSAAAKLNDSSYPLAHSKGWRLAEELVTGRALAWGSD